MDGKNIIETYNQNVKQLLDSVPANASNEDWQTVKNQLKVLNDQFSEDIKSCTWS
jgi:hypothetical protein